MDSGSQLTDNKMYLKKNTHYKWAQPSKKYLFQFTLKGVISGITTNLHIASFVSLL